MSSPQHTSWNALQAKKDKDRAVRKRSVPFASPKTLQLRRAAQASAAKGITKVVAWFEKKGYTVRFGPQFRDEVYPTLKRVTICSRPSLMSQLIALLHEAGHIMLYADKTYNDRFGKGWPAIHARKQVDSLAHRAQVVEEEIEAWNRGQRLFERLGLTVERSTWLAIRYRCITNYCGYAAKKSA